MTGPDSPPARTAQRDPARLEKHSVTVAGHRTSISLETAFWDALREMAEARGVSVNTLIGEIDAGRTGNLSGAIRVHVLRYHHRQGPKTP